MRLVLGVMLYDLRVDEKYDVFSDIGRMICQTLHMTGQHHGMSTRLHICRILHHGFEHVPEDRGVIIVDLVIGFDLPNT